MRLPFRPDRVSARVITAFQDAERRARFMRELAAGLSPKEKLALERTIAKIAREGYVSAPSDTVTGVVDICHPIFDASGIAVAAMTVPYVRMRDNPTPLDETRRVASRATSASTESRTERAHRARPARSYGFGGARKGLGAARSLSCRAPFEESRSSARERR